MLNEVIFYSLEKTIKRYRQFAQAHIDHAGIDITIDQWLVLNVIRDSPELGQVEIGERIFKDQASVARIIELLVKKKLIVRTPSASDRRKLDMQLTESGQRLMNVVTPIVHNYRRLALEGLNEKDIDQLKIILDVIFTNCLSTPHKHDTIRKTKLAGQPDAAGS
ncbi:hypothetical protein GCM10023189_39850 [Nibrella saemangeumensis]|uniref:HTH marR-type domain-containing protein n=1 Tax=Nibrella saemangeumensis TaxID=1084526 RepID=A0ABP8NAK3_9BACT